MESKTNHSALWRILLLLGLFLAVLPGLAPRPHAFDRALYDASSAYRHNALSQAAQEAARAAAYSPWRSDLWEIAGRYALSAGDFPRAIQYLQQVEQQRGQPFTVERPGLSAQGWSDLGDACWQSGDYPAALHAWQMSLQRFGASAGLLDRLARAYVAQGDYATAQSNLQVLVLMQPQDASLHYRLGLLMAAQDPGQALEHLELAATLDAQYEQTAGTLRRAVTGARAGDDPVYTLVSAGRALASLGEWDYAAQSFRQATLFRPDYAEAWAYLGEALQHCTAGSPAGAACGEQDSLAALQKSLALDPASLAARSFLSLYWTRRARYDLATENLQAAIRIDPGSPALQAQLGSTLAAAGDLSGAYVAYQKAIELAPRDPVYWRHLVEFSLDHDYNIKEVALPMARQLVIVFPDDAANLVLMGKTLLALHDLANAERFLLRARQSTPRDARVYLLLGQVYILQNDRTAASLAFQQALAFGAGGPVAAQAQRLLGTYFP